MPLEEYARKRKFDKTPEPAPEPEATPPPTGSRFCVQRHSARRLHYDLRLEIDGTLKSWAVPQGPTLDPSEKRLAVHVEDHPLDYGDFEGNIPAGQYGAGSVMLWDRGTFDLLGDKPATEQLQRGDFKFRLHGEKLRGDYALVRMKNRGKGNEWLLIKKKDAAATPGWDVEQFAASVVTGRTQEEIARQMPARITAGAGGRRRANPSALPGAVEAPMPGAITPMMAFAAEKPPAGDGWLYEIKWDGVRTLCFLDGEGVRLVSRKGILFERQYPELSVAPHYLEADTAILDGEITRLDEAGRPSFSRLQPRIMATDPNSVAHLARLQPVTYFVFDLLYLDGYDLRQVPLAERKRLLASILKPGPVLRYSEHFEAGGGELLDLARAQGLEGVVAKRAASRYESRRSQDWLKIKITREQEFVICGYTRGERDFFGALVLGHFQDGRLMFSGCVGTGFDRKLMEKLFGILQPLEIADRPFVEEPLIPQEAVWVRPVKVCTVRFHEWTGEGRLRAPVFVGLRPDADTRDCVRHPADSVEAAPVVERPPLVDGSREEVSLTVDGRRLKFTHVHKIYYPREGYTKRDVINYYDAVADLLLPHLKDRPLSLRRYPNGIHESHFFQKNAAQGFPSWIPTQLIEDDGGEPKQYVVCADRATLLHLANLGCIDQNPWMSRTGSLDHPDFVLIDLDPQDCGYGRIVEAARLVRARLDQLGLEGYPKTTGGDGMHVYIPLEPVYAYEQTRAFAEIIARLVASERPDLFTIPRPLVRREKGKVYFDYLQNGRGKTISAPYVLRAYEGAPVATPLDWSEVTAGLEPAQFHLRNAPERFARLGDLFGPVLRNRQRLEPAMRILEAMLRPG